MATIPFPYGMVKKKDMRLSRIDYHMSQVPLTYDPVFARREQAELARSFRAVDDSLRQIERRLRAIEEVTFP